MLLNYALIILNLPLDLTYVRLVLYYSCTPYLPRMDETFVYALFQASGAHGFPHQPQLQTVDLAAALH